MHVDDYSQYAPAVAVFGLQALGIKGKNNIKDELIIYALSVGISTAVVYPLKTTKKIWRPDHSAPNSFHQVIQPSHLLLPNFYEESIKIYHRGSG